VWRTELGGGAEQHVLPGQLFHFLVHGRGCGGQNLEVGLNNTCYLDSCSTFLSMAEAVEDRTRRWAERMLPGQLFHFLVDGRGRGGQNLEVGLKTVPLTHHPLLNYKKSLR
jgi:hypothetical protein